MYQLFKWYIRVNGTQKLQTLLALILWIVQAPLLSVYGSIVNRGSKVQLWIGTGTQKQKVLRARF